MHESRVIKYQKIMAMPFMKEHEFVLNINQRVINVIRNLLTTFKIYVIGAFCIYGVFVGRQDE